MLKKIYLRNTKSLVAKQIELDFSEGVNIIIGPKGGGKSTLFDLVAGLAEKYIPETVINALAAYDLEFERAIYDNGEILVTQQLSKKNKKEKEADFCQRNDVIFQDDPIKKDINNLDEIKKQKSKYIKEFLYQTTSINDLISQIHDFYLQMEKIYKNRNQKDINWGNAFNYVTKKSDALEPIINLNYRDNDLSSKIKKDLDNLNEVIEKLDEHENSYQLYEKGEPFGVFEGTAELDLENDKFNEKYKEGISSLILNIKTFGTFIKTRQTQLNRLKLMSNSFKLAYAKITNEIKTKDFEGKGLMLYSKHATDFFKDLAIITVDLKRRFNRLINQDLVLKFNDKGRVTELLTYKIKNEVKLTQDNIFDLLKVVLPSPGNSVNDINKWISNVIKDSFKTFDSGKLINALVKPLESEVTVLADNKDYETMSLGQKSIFGIRYKYERSKNMDLFLDQPEDNLDNYTITESIIKMIKEKPKNTQIFIVTHNANIGILTDTKKVIVADLSNPNQQYTDGTLVSMGSHDSEAAVYLEGGTSALDQRYKIIKGVK